MKNISKSNILAAKYLNGDKNITLKQIEHQDFLDNVANSATKFSYNNKILYKIWYIIFYSWYNLWK